MQMAKARARAWLQDEYDALMPYGDDPAQAGLEETDPVTRTGRKQLETDPGRAAARLIIGSMDSDSESEDIAGALSVRAGAAAVLRAAPRYATVSPARRLL